MKSSQKPKAKGGRRPGAGRKPGAPSKATELRHEAFCQEYVVDLDARRAASTAGYKHPGALLRNSRVKARIAELKRHQIERLQLSADELLVGLTHIARLDLRNVFDPAGALKHPNDWDSNTALAVAEIEFKQRRLITKTHDGGESVREEVSLVKISANDRLAALEQLMRHLNLLEGTAEASSLLSLARFATKPSSNDRRPASLSPSDSISV